MALAAALADLFGGTGLGPLLTPAEPILLALQPEPESGPQGGLGAITEQIGELGQFQAGSAAGGIGALAQQQPGGGQFPLRRQGLRDRLPLQGPGRRSRVNGDRGRGIGQCGDQLKIP